MKALSQCALYTFIDTAYLQGRKPEALAEELCAGGSDLVQLRAKTSSPEEIRQMAARIAPITRAAGVGLVINDHPEIAREVGAQFCHLGQEDFFEDPSRSSLARAHLAYGISGLRDSAPRLGLSSHAPEQAQIAIEAGPAYIAVGPVYATGTKPSARPVTLEYVRWAADHVNIPWFAIGGITMQNLDEVLKAGARRICVVSAILNARNAAKACQEFKERLQSNAVQ